MKSKEEILKEMKNKPLFKCWGWCKKKEETHYCPRCLEILWCWIFLVLILIGIIIFLIIYILKNK